MMVFACRISRGDNREQLIAIIPVRKLISEILTCMVERLGDPMHNLAKEYLFIPKGIFVVETRP